MDATKNHELSQNKLSVKQLNAIDLLVAGKTDQEVSEVVGVSRETVTRWRNENPYFAAALNTQRKHIWQAAHEKLRGLVNKAVDTLAVAIEGGDVKAAVEVLKAVDIYGNVNEPWGPEDPQLILWQYAMEWAENEMAKKGPKDRFLDDDIFRNQDILELTRRRMEEIKKELEASEASC